MSPVQEQIAVVPEISENETIHDLFMSAIDSDGFVIPFDLVWQWTGYSRKDNAKRAMTKLAVDGVGYKISIQPRKLVGMEKVLNGGKNRECIMMTFDAARVFLLSNVNASPATRNFVCNLMKEADRYALESRQANKRRLEINKAFKEEREEEKRHKSTHDTVADELAQNELGERECIISSGRIDVRTEKEAIEVKEVGAWKHAIGQALVYSIDTGLLPRVHMYGGRLTGAQHNIATQLGVRVTYSTIC